MWSMHADVVAGVLAVGCLRAAGLGRNGAPGDGTAAAAGTALLASAAGQRSRRLPPREPQSVAMSDILSTSSNLYQSVPVCLINYSR